MRTLCAGLLGLLIVGCSTQESSHPSAAAVPPSDPQSNSDAPVEAELEQRLLEAPVLVQDAELAHAAAQKRLGHGLLTAVDLVRFTALENPSALRPFYRALEELRTGMDRDGKVRVLVWGSSSVATDRYTGYLRSYLQHRFGDGGPGFVSLVPLWRWHRHEEVTVDSSSGWDIEHALRRRRNDDGRFGLLGAAASTNRPGARARVRVQGDPVTHIELFYLSQPDGGRFSVAVGGAKTIVVDTQADRVGPGYHELALEGGTRELSVRTEASGAVRLFGAVLERPGPGVVVDELGIGGSEAADQLSWDPELWQDNVSRRDPSLFVLAYGANAAGKDDLSMEGYRDGLNRVLARFRSFFPGTACVLVGPADFYARADDGSWNVEPRVGPVESIQRELAPRYGCAYWSTRSFMGGEGTMKAWVESGLARPDHLHFTPVGYRHMGRVIADALMGPYDLIGLASGSAVDQPQMVDRR